MFQNTENLFHGSGLLVGYFKRCFLKPFAVKDYRHSTMLRKIPLTFSFPHFRHDGTALDFLIALTIFINRFAAGQTIKQTSMKTIFTLFAVMVMSMAAIAVPVKNPSRAQSMLTIKSQGSGDIRVVIDGRRFDPAYNSMVLYNLKPGRHSIKIFRQRNNRPFDFFGKRYELVFNRSIVVRPRTNMLIAIDRFGNSQILQRPLQRQSRFVYEWERLDQNFERDRSWNDDRNRKRSPEWYETDDDFRGYEFDFDRGTRFDDIDEDIYYDAPKFRAISDHEFSMVLQSMQKEWFEGNKMKSAQQVIATNYLTSLQVKLMLQLFAFENNKLELAKQAYPKTVDQRMFLATVSDVFSFSSSKEELARFIRNY
jgi:hypothetical protein